jgi:hypothetical protein
MLAVGAHRCTFNYATRAPICKCKSTPILCALVQIDEAEMKMFSVTHTGGAPTRGRAGLAFAVRPRWLGLLGDFASNRPTERCRQRLREMTTFFFVSYAHRDAECAEALIREAKADGHCFWVDEGNLSPGKRWAADIVAAIRASTAVIMLCSRQAFASHDVYREIAIAGRYAKPILPLFLDDTAAPDEFLYYLSIHQAIRMQAPHASACFRHALSALSAGPTAAARTECPIGA